MAGSAILKLQIIADAKSATSALKDLSGASDTAGTRTTTMSDRLKSLGKAAAVAAGAAALGGLVMVFKTGFQEQKDFLAGQAQLTAGLKSTHNAANTSVDSMEKLASTIQNYSGQTDDSIVSSEKLMLTFTNVRNAAGKNNDIFNQAIKLTADMAARMGGDASTYAIQLGKALNDPIKGLTSLTRIGVSFTEGQKKQITALTETGHTMAAQKIIIAELNKEFGGSAKAFGQTLPGQMERAKRAFEDISQSVVASLMPVLTQLMSMVLKDLLPGFKAFIGWVSNNFNWLGPLAAAVGVVVVAFKLWAAATTLLGISMDTLPVIGWISAIVALGAAIIYAYNHCETFRKIVQFVFKAISTYIKIWWKSWVIAFNAVKKVVLVVGKAIGVAIKAVWKVIVAVAKTIFKIWVTPYKLAWNFIKNLVTKWAPAIAGWARNIVQKIFNALSNLFDRVTAPFKRAWDWIRSHVSSWAGDIANWVRNIAERVWNALSNLFEHITAPFKRAWDWIRSNVSSWAGTVANWISSMVSRIGSILARVWDVITTPFRRAWDWLKSAAGNVADWFRSIPGAIASALSGVFNAITAPFKSAWNWIKNYVLAPISRGWNAVANALNAIQITLPKVHIPFDGDIGGGTIGLPHVPTLPEFATGAFVSKPTIGLLGEAGNGEWVLPDDKLRRLLRSELAAMGGTTIIVQGALDPDAVARQIENLLRGRGRRVGGVRNVGAVGLSS